MKYAIIHEIPGRMRIRLAIPGGFHIDESWIKDHFAVIDGVNEVSFNGRSKSILVKHRNDTTARDNVIRGLENIPAGKSHRKPHKNTGSSILRQKKKAVIGSVFLFLSSPLVPLPVKPFLAFYGAMPIFKKGVKSLFQKRINIDVLDSSAIGIAIGIKNYKTAGVISLLLKAGDYLDEWIKHRSHKMLTDMFSADGDDHAWIRTEKGERMVSRDELKQGDNVVSRTGSRIPVDGIVIEGEAMVNQSSMTGEPLPVMKRKGTTVYAGTTVEEGTIVINASNVGSDTRVAKIVRVIYESEGLKADVQSHAERLADRIVPYTFLLSGLTYALTGNLYRAASVLLVDYSCAIKISTPLSIMSGMLMSAKKGVLIKGGKFIEKLAKTDTFVFDKTGTLTKAEPSIIDVIPFNGYERDFILKHAACVEEHFPHPVATAVVNKAKNEGLIHEEEHSEVEYIAAHGIASHLGGRRILVGSRHFIIEDEGIEDSCCREIINMASSEGHSILYVAIDNNLAGLIVIEDPLREEALEFIKRLKDSGISKILMITGDTDASAKNAAERLGIKEYFSQMLPDTKIGLIERLKNSGNVVAMVGDGINDSAALAHADVGISMKHSADIAKEACDVLLLDGSLMSILEAKKISERAMSIIRQNFKYIVGVNSSLILLGLAGLSTTTFSAVMHNTSTVLSALNSIGLASDKGASAMEDRCKSFLGGA